MAGPSRSGYDHAMITALPQILLTAAFPGEDIGAAFGEDSAPDRRVQPEPEALALQPDPAIDTALITGASSGIGRALAREFARHGHSLVIVAPVEGELNALAASLERDYGVSVCAIAKDLTQENATQEVFEAARGQGFRVDILVNNAGRGRRGLFWENSLDRDLDTIRLNIEAVLRLTRLFLPPMLRRHHGRILNTASLASFEPGPHLAVYHATKAFVLSLSESLATELKGTGVTLTALCPGATDTDFFPKAGMVDTPAFQEGSLMAPRLVAEAAYAAVMRGDRLCIPGAMNKVAAARDRLTTEEAQAEKNRRLYSDTDPAQRKREPGEVRAREEARHSTE